MQVNMRRESRHVATGIYTITWHSLDGRKNTVEARGIDLSNTGVRITCQSEMKPGTSVFVRAQFGIPTGPGIVRHCIWRESGYIIGIQLNLDGSPPVTRDESVDYYEFLQISPRAEMATVNRIYKFLAGRFHPDNPETGDPEKFLLLRRAFDILSDPQRRAEYDATRQTYEVKPIPALAAIDFMDGVEGEMNRRMAVLSLLYHKRRSNSLKPSVSLLDMERQMSFPREYLDFTIWYLRSKQYISMDDGSAFSLTAQGVDYVESNVDKIPMLDHLLNGPVDPAAGPGPQKREDPANFSSPRSATLPQSKG